MKTLKIILLFTSFCFGKQLNSQNIITQTWESSSTLTDNGVSALSVSSSAVIGSPGASGNGLNAGLPKDDINLVFDGNLFNVDGIDFSIDFQRDESTGNFVKRGNSLVFGISGGSLTVTFRLDDGAGSYIEVQQSSIYTVPNDDTFRTYRFFYNPNSGEAQVLVDGVVQWTYNGAVGTPMYWGGTGDLMIGDGLDGTGFNQVFLDNLIIDEIGLNFLPIELVAFHAINLKDKEVLLEWETASEINNDFFTIEKSVDGIEIVEIAEVKGAGNSTESRYYEFLDQVPYSGVSYYRIKQTDFDGAYAYSDWKSVQLQTKNDAELNLVLYPNPNKGDYPVRFLLSGLEIDEMVQFQILNSQGSVFFNRVLISSQKILEGELFPKGQLNSGIYIVRVITDQQCVSKKLIIAD